MKFFVLLFSFAMLSCASQNLLPYEPSFEELKTGCAIAGLALPSSDSNSPLGLHPVTTELQKAGIRCWEGDHAGRMTELYCLESDFFRARTLVAGLPAELRSLVFYFKPA